MDAGFRDSTLIARLRHSGITPSQLSGILVTHEHIDHILGLPALMKRYAVPVIADVRTLEAIEQFITNSWQGEFAAIERYPDMFLSSKLVKEEQRIGRPARGPFTPPYIIPALTDMVAAEAPTSAGGKICATNRPLAVGDRIVIGDIEVTSFPVSHDAVAPCGYLLSAGGCRVCVVIDSGEVTPTMLEAMQQADLLVLESNHDRERLLRGPYPYTLKMRILSSTGHLSNDQAADAVLRTWRTDSVRWLWLSHLSRTNNTPKIALNSMVSRLQAARVHLAQVHITVLPPDMGSVWDTTQLWQAPSLWEMQA